MAESSAKFHFPTDIALKSSPLVEAWLEIRWQLESGPAPGFVHDPDFPFALGKFYANVRDDYGFTEDLEASNAPPNMLPYVVRHRFRSEVGGWPLLQLGPGVATVNFTSPYTWKDFKGVALYLRDKLLDAYDKGLETKAAALRYRNAMPCEYTSSDLLAFLAKNLNTSIELPQYVPGSLGRAHSPSGANITIAFDLVEPEGKGTLILATGIRKEKLEAGAEEQETEHVIFELEVSSEGKNAPDLGDEQRFDHWLTSAHAVLHEWFFSFIEGTLFEQYHD